MTLKETMGRRERKIEKVKIVFCTYGSLVASPPVKSVPGDRHAAIVVFLTIWLMCCHYDY